MSTEVGLLFLVIVVAVRALAIETYAALPPWKAALLVVALVLSVIVGLIVLWELKSVPARNRRRILERVRNVPPALRSDALGGVRLGKEVELGIPIFLPDSVRLRHVHIIGATGSGKTESVILNFFGKTWRGAWVRSSWMPKETLLSYGPCSLSFRGNASGFST